MINYKKGDILHENVEALVNTVNCVGVMGRGIALQFKKTYPANFKAYVDACKKNEVTPGKMFVFNTNQLGNPQYIINFPTKLHWRYKSKMEYIESGLEDLVRVIKEKNIRSIAIPPLGSGLGGLDWQQVRQRIENALAHLDQVSAIVFEPQKEESKITNESKIVGIQLTYEELNLSENPSRSLKMPVMTPGRAALIGLIDRYLGGLLDPFVTLLEIHKLMYFMQMAGEPLQLTYKKGHYGPYAENLRHVLNRIEGHMLSGYSNGEDSPTKPLSLVPGAVERASAFLKNYPDTRTRFEKVVNLVDGFESPFGLELLATVHWIFNKNNPISFGDMVQKIYDWNSRKKQFSSRQIKVALNVLAEKDWITIPDAWLAETSLS